MLAHMVIHVTLPAGFSCPGKKRAPNNVGALKNKRTLSDPVGARFI